MVFGRFPILEQFFAQEQDNESFSVTLARSAPLIGQNQHPNRECKGGDVSTSFNC